MGLTDVGFGIGKELLTPVRELGDFIRAQRTAAQISLRSLADRTGVSNPYLSQVERGLRKPSAAILTQIADGLSISAETLLVKAGLLKPREPSARVMEAIRTDPALNARHRALLLDIYRAFVHESAREAGIDNAQDGHDDPARRSPHGVRRDRNADETDDAAADLTSDAEPKETTP